MRPALARFASTARFSAPYAEALQLAVDRERAGRAPSCAARIDSTSSTIWPRRSLMTRRLPGLPPSVASCASSTPSWPRVVHAGEAEDVRGDLAARVVAAVFRMLVDAGMAERRDRVRGVRRHLPLEVDEIAAKRAELACRAPRNRCVSNAASLRALLGVELDVGRESPRSTSPASRPPARRRCGRGRGRGWPGSR